MTRRIAPLLASLALVLTLLPGVTIAAPAAYERWYVVELDGQRTGWMSESLEVADDGDLVSETRMVMKINRMGSDIEIDIRTRFVETPEGEPVSMRSRQDLGAMTVDQLYVFDETGVDMKTRQMGRETTQRMALPEGDWLTPGEVRTFVEKRLAAGAKVIRYSSLDASVGLEPTEVVQRVGERTTVEVMGKTVPAIEWEVEQSVMPGMRVVAYVDDDGFMLRQAMPVGGMNIELIASSKALALAEFDAPELMNRSFLRVEEGIADARRSTKGSYLIRYTEDALDDLHDADIFTSDGVQRVQRVDDRTVRVTVDLTDPLPAKINDEVRAQALGSSTYIDPTDGAIVELTARALKEAGLTQESDPVRIGKALERFVAFYIEDKMLGVGFATASETCRTREGDCSEHGMLLAAMLRVANIPSRVVSGLVYADGFAGERRIFGYHMWAQALVEREGVEVWMDLDAAVMPMDATHIAISRGTMADEAPVDSMLELIAVFGAIEIEVESVE